MQARFDFEHAPGHLIRRAHQVSVAEFADRMQGLDVTPVQFAILNALMEGSGIDQVTLAARVVFDAATIGSVIGRLEAKGWVRRAPAAEDRRRKLLWLTPEGEKACDEMTPRVESAQQGILAPLDEAERQQLAVLLAKLVTRRDAGPHT